MNYLSGIKQPMKYTMIIFAAMSFLFMFSCKAKKTATNECATFLTYTGGIKTILDNNCANSCHSAANKADGIDLSTYSSSKSASSKSSFLGAVRHLAGFTPMPLKASKLSDADIQALNCWVKNGSPE
jgi:hypothetical protein